MRQMKQSLNAFAWTVAGLWVVGGIGAVFYAKQQDIPARIWMAALPAMLLEASMYIAPGFAAVRERLARLGGWLTPVLAGSAVIPYVLMSVGAGNFRLEWLGALLVLAGMVTLWFRVTPRLPAFDLLFLVFMAGVYLTRVFVEIYVNPSGKPPFDILGRMMWVRLGIISVLLVRKVDGVEFGFLPKWREWAVGTAHFLLLMPVVLPVAWWIGFVHPKEVVFGPKTLIAAAGTFLGMLWVVALGEEFFFRGLLQQWLQRWTGSFPAGLAMAALIFGAAHITARGFPNWRYSLVAMIAGVFYGLAYARGKSIRASMVTHALVNTAWRVFFS